MSEGPRADAEGRSEPIRRAPYVVPDIAWEDDLGARPGLVAACGKVGTASPACEALPSGS
jgi:hypothetical protein